MDTQEIGLRERKKRATRAALSAAAFRLSVERGVDAVTVEDIAAEVDVSPRTFFNYFASKEQAVLTDGTDRATRAVAALAQRPEGEPPWDALCRALVVVADDDAADERWAARLRLVAAHPALTGQHLSNFAAMERMLMPEVARRMGCGEDDLHVRLMVATAVAVVRVAAGHWADSAADAALSASVERALAGTATRARSAVPAPA